jgi:arylsulfatase A
MIGFQFKQFKQPFPVRDIKKEFRNFIHHTEMLMRTVSACTTCSFILIMAFMMSCGTDQAQGEENTRPNIILIMADDLGYETLGANGGSSYETPHLDQLAARGMRFEHCYAQPLCTPTRVQLMTGIYNVRNYVRFGLLEESQLTFGHLFQQAGYATCVVGKWQLGKDPSSPQHAGFDTHCLWQVTEGRMDSTGRDTRYSKPVLEIDGKLIAYGEAEYGPDIVCQYGLDFIERKHRSGMPFFLYYPMILTHCPFSPTPFSPEWSAEDSTTMTYKGEAGYFKDMVSYMDHLVGRLVGKLEELGIQDNTLIVFTGDNGTDVPVVSLLNGREIAGAKSKSTDAGTRVPLIVCWPERIRANSTQMDLIDFTDFLPTLCEAANISTDSLGLDGRSFLAQLLGEKGDPREWIYSWYSRNGETDKARVFARNHRYKLYHTGEFYDIPSDYEEQHPLDISSVDAEAKETHRQLMEVLDHYAMRRLDKVDPPKEILVFTGGHDFERESFFKIFQEMPGIRFRELIQPEANEVYDAPLSDSADVLIFYDMVQEISEAQKKAFLNLLDQGKGMIFLHHSLASYQEWGEFEDIIGGRYVLSGEDSSTYRHDVEMPVQVVSRDHPVTRGMEDFFIRDEVYGNFRVGTGVTPLLTCSHPESGNVIGWANSHGKSRIVYLQLGHDHHAYDHPDFRRLMKQAIDWVGVNDSP